MKRFVLFVVLLVVSHTAAAGVASITVQKPDDAVSYQLNDRNADLPEIGQFVEKVVKDVRSIHPRLEPPLITRVEAGIGMEELIPFFVCLRRAGARTCKLEFSKKHDGQEWYLHLTIDLEQQLHAKPKRGQPTSRNTTPNIMLERYSVKPQAAPRKPSA